MRIKNILNYTKPGLLVMTVTVITAIVLVVCFLTNPISKDKDLPQLSDEKKVELEVAYYDFIGVRRTWYQPGESGIRFFRYYGSFEEYDIVLQTGSLDAIGGVTIAGEQFEFATPSTFYAFRDGTIYELKELYDNGNISAESISKLSQLHKAGTEQLPAPPEALKAPFQRAYAAYTEPLLWDAKESKIGAAHYYGSYEGYDFLYYVVSIPPESKSHYSSIVAGYEFTFDCSANIVAVQNGRILPSSEYYFLPLSLEQLYEEGKINAETVAEINRVHKLYENKK